MRLFTLAPIVFLGLYVFATPAVQAQHWILAEGQTAIDCEDPLGHWVRIHLPSEPETYLEDRLWFEADEPGENLRMTMLDIEELDPDWQDGDEVVVQILEKYPGDGYYAGPQTITLNAGTSYEYVQMQLTRDGITQDPHYPDCLDTDGDLITDVSDNCPNTANAPGYMEYEQPDADGDRVGDSCDACPNTIPGVTVDAAGCPDPHVTADLDWDGDVDADDFGAFDACLSGPAVPYGGDCGASDFDADNDVDQSDFGVFQRCYSGTDVPADAGCPDT